jgi:Holliday junction resolvasome RuvABC endonuclease subunit
MKIKEFDGGLTGNQEITVGIDQSLTGFALSVVSVEFPNLHKTWVIKSSFKGIQRLNDIHDWFYGTLSDLHRNGNVVVNVAMEGTVLQSQAASILGELAGIVKMDLYTFFDARVKPNCSLPLQIPPMTLKKYATGKGTAKKQEMLLQIYKRWGVEFNDDNAADAYALARLAADAYNGVEGELFDKIKDGAYRDLVE